MIRDVTKARMPGRMGDVFSKESHLDVRLCRAAQLKSRWLIMRLVSLPIRNI